MNDVTIWLFSKPNVVLVDVSGKTNKITRGVDTGRPAIVVGVVKKLPIAALAVEDVIPMQVDGVETDVIEAGIIHARKARTDEWNPAPGGVSIGHGPSGKTGTFGGIVRKLGVRYILSNNHVLANENRASISDIIFQPGKVDGGFKDRAKLTEFVWLKGFAGDEPEPPPEPPSDCPVAGSIVTVCNWFAEKLGRKTRIPRAIVPVQRARSLSENVNKVDVALARPNDDAEFLDEILEIGILSGEAESEVDMKIKGSGRTSGLVHDEIAMVNAAARVRYERGELMFEDQIITKGPMIRAGDSGIYISTEDNRIVGEGFAGSSTLSIINKFSNIKEALSLD